MSRIAVHIWTLLNAYERGHDIPNDGPLREELRAFAERLERVHAIVVGPSPVEGAHVLAPSAAEAATLLAIREETGHDVALADPVTALGDSLALLIVVLAIEERLGVTIDDAVFDARRTPTVADVVREVEKARQP